MVAASGAGAGVVVIVVLLVGVCALPTIVAVARHHHQAGAVAAINLFLGWTLIGWVVSLAMALSAHRAPVVILNQYGQQPTIAGPPPPGWYPDPLRVVATDGPLTALTGQLVESDDGASGSGGRLARMGRRLTRRVY